MTWKPNLFTDYSTSRRFTSPGVREVVQAHQTHTTHRVGQRSGLCEVVQVAQGEAQLSGLLHFNLRANSLLVALDLNAEQGEGMGFNHR